MSDLLSVANIQNGPSLNSTQRRLFLALKPMDYRTFTNDSLTMMYEGIRGALASDDAQKAEGDQPRVGIRETPDWRVHAANLESEMLRRGMFFQIIDWSEDQAQLPF